MDKSIASAREKARSQEPDQKECLAPLKVLSAKLSSRENWKEHWYCQLNGAQPDGTLTEGGRDVAYSLLDHFPCS